MYSFDLTKRYVETMEIDDFLDLFPQSEVLRRLGNLCSCIICAAALYSRNKHIDLFPRTSSVEKMASLRSKKRLTNSSE